MKLFNQAIILFPNYLNKALLPRTHKCPQLCDITEELDAV